MKLDLTSVLSSDLHTICGGHCLACHGCCLYGRVYRFHIHFPPTPPSPLCSSSTLSYSTILRFLVSLNEDVEANSKQLKELIQESGMVQYYQEVCQQFGWTIDGEWVATTLKSNAEKVKELEAAIADAVENLGESEVREANLILARHYCRTGQKKLAIEAFATTTEKTVGVGHKLDIVFTLARMGFFYHDNDLVVRSLGKGEDLMKVGGDWERRNRLKVYNAYHAMSLRNFEKASPLFLDTLANFNSEEMFSYSQNVFYAVLCSMLTLARVQFKKKIVDSPEVKSVSADRPMMGQLLSCFYDGNYAKYFEALASITDEMKKDVATAPHVSYYGREMRIRCDCSRIATASAFSHAQCIPTIFDLIPLGHIGFNGISLRRNIRVYRSVPLQFVPAATSAAVVTCSELARFVAAGRLSCKIDAVSGIIETTRPDTKNGMYLATLRQADIVTSRLQKLSRVTHL